MKFSEQFSREFRRNARWYFAPLVGAARGIRDEYRRLEAEDVVAVVPLLAF